MKTVIDVIQTMAVNNKNISHDQVKWSKKYVAVSRCKLLLLRLFYFSVTLFFIGS